MNEKLYCGRGPHIPYADYMAFINLVFGFTAPEQKFEGLLPKLYREERRPQDSNYIVTENGQLMAAVGAYDHEITVCGCRIPCRGIGNVAVHPDARGKGYMKATMNAALEDMVRDGIALSTLGGRRQRYQYFSYDKAGLCYTFSVTRDNLRHTYGTSEVPVSLKVIEDKDDPLIHEILALSETAVFHPIRAFEDYLDVANTWHARLLAFTDPAEDDRFVGYCIMDQGNAISELCAVRDEDVMSIVRSVSAHLESGLTVCLPEHQAAYIEALTPVAEGVSLGCSMSYTVLNYRLITEAFLRLKLSYADLPDGEVSLLIHGFAGDERIRLTVKGKSAAVEALPEGTPVDYELSHLEALNVLFAPVSPRRNGMSDLLRLWLPLPLWMYRADEV